MDLVLGAGVVLVWGLAWHMRRSGANWPYFNGLAVVITAIYAMIVAADAHMTGLLNTAHRGLSGWGMPLTHWFPSIPRCVCVVGALIAAGIIDKIARLTRRTQ